MTATATWFFGCYRRHCGGDLLDAASVAKTNGTHSVLDPGCMKDNQIVPSQMMR